MLAWLRDLNAKERRTMVACFAGWTLMALTGNSTATSFRL